MDDSNQDTVRSIAELIKSEPDTNDQDLDETAVQIDVEHELRKRGFPNYSRTDSQAPESIVSKSKGEKPKLVLTPKVISEIVLVCILAACIIVATTIIYHFYKETKHQLEVGKRIYFNEETRLIHVNNINKEPVLYGHLGIDIPAFHLPFDCSDPDNRGVELCLQWKGEASMNITYYEEDEKSCYDIEWESLDSSIIPHDCYQLSGGSWYGGGLRKNHQWPIEKMAYEKTALLPGNIHDEDTFGPVVERYWLSSLGVAFFVEDDSPLHVSMNQTDTDDQICLYADYSNSIYPNQREQLPKLNYTICVGDNVKEIHKFVVNKIGKPSQTHPAEKYFEKPVWSFGKQLTDDYVQANVIQYAYNIFIDKDYSYSMLVLDHGWQIKEGDLEFDPVRFPNPEEMVRTLQNENFDICVAIHPYANTDSNMYQAGIFADNLVFDGSGQTPGLSKWWDGPQHSSWYQGVASSIDMHATEWWKSFIKVFSSKYGNMHFRMNHGDMDNLPYKPQFHSGFENPGRYSSILAAFTASLGDSSQIQSAYKAQNQAVMLHLGEFNSTWESLESVIPSVLHAGIIGYPYVMPDVIGGNHLYSGSNAPIPEKELYIRWLQLSTFLPVMQFSVIPSNYDNETVTIAKAMIALRRDFVSSRVVSLVKVASTSMDPIIRPMWWRDPTDSNTFGLDDQFLLGDDVLVAPVLKQSTKRDVYFPNGTWRDQTTQQTHTGPVWRRDMDVPLNRVLYFTLIQ